jgi:flagellar biogenesis protein FliO
MDVVMNLLFTHPIGILSLFTILFMIGMAIYLVSWFKRKMDKPEE